MSELALEIKALAKEQGAHLVGIASVDRMDEGSVYSECSSLEAAKAGTGL